MDICLHPVGREIQLAAEAKGMNFKAIPPGPPDGEWHFKVWPKGRPEPSDEDEL